MRVKRQRHVTQKPALWIQYYYSARRSNSTSLLQPQNTVSSRILSDPAHTGTQTHTRNIVYYTTITRTIFASVVMTSDLTSKSGPMSLMTRDVFGRINYSVSIPVDIKSSLDGRIMISENCKTVWAHYYDTCVWANRLRHRRRKTTTDKIKNVQVASGNFSSRVKSTAPIFFVHYFLNPSGLFVYYILL